MKPHAAVLLVLCLAALCGCAQSPLYETSRVAGGTRDEVPRDGNGEPILSAIRPPLLPPPPTR